MNVRIGLNQEALDVDNRPAIRRNWPGPTTTNGREEAEQWRKENYASIRVWLGEVHAAALREESYKHKTLKALQEIAAKDHIKVEGPNYGPITTGTGNTVTLDSPRSDSATPSESSRRKDWSAKRVALVGGGFVLLAALISAPWLGHLVVESAADNEIEADALANNQEKRDTAEPLQFSTVSSREVQREVHNLRKLEPLEDDLPACKMPNGTFFYTSVDWIDMTVSYKEGCLAGRGHASSTFNADLETHRHADGSYAFILFCSKETVHRILHGTGTTDAILSVRSWGEMNQLVEVALTSLLECSSRRIQIEGGESVKVVDVRIDAHQ